MRVVVLKGGRSSEHEVSLRSGARVEDALDRLGHEVVAIDVGPDLVDRLGEAAAAITPSEEEVLRLVAKSHTTEEIGSLLSISTAEAATLPHCCSGA